MRPTWGYASYRSSETPAVYAILAAMGIIFIVDWIANDPISLILSWTISPEWPRSLALWQPFTFPFAHDRNFLYLLSDGLVLFFFGGSLERAWGSARFLLFFFLAGIVPGLVELGLSYIWTPGTQFFGMIGGFSAMVVAFAALQPYATVLLFIFPLQARWLAVLAVAYELFVRWPMYGGPGPAIIVVGATVCFAYWFTVTRFRFRLSFGQRGPTLRERLERWQQRRRMREWQRRVSRAERPEDLFKDRR
jgi:membrane associated rhomboid family serine protease